MNRSIVHLRSFSDDTITFGRTIHILGTKIKKPLYLLLLCEKTAVQGLLLGQELISLPNIQSEISEDTKSGGKVNQDC